MRRSRVRARAIAQAGVVAALCLTLAHCGKMSSKVDPKYGVAASPRVVGPGEPVPKGGGRYSVGKPYTVAGRTYVPEENFNYRAEGIASWYGDDFHGRQTANGEVFDMHSIAAAHPTLPLPSYVRVTNLRNNRSLIVRVNDRGPYHADRVIDVSVRAAKLLDFHQNGVSRVRVEYVGRASLTGSDDAKLEATLRNGHESPTRSQVRVASSRPFSPEYFDPKPMMGEPAPTPTRRPVSLVQHDEQPPVVAARRVATTTEMSAVARAPIAPVAQPAPVRAAAVSHSGETFSSRFGNAQVLTLPASPTTAYAPSAPTLAERGLVSGRGLY